MKTAGESFNRWLVMSVGLHAGFFGIAVFSSSLFGIQGDALWGSATGGTEGIQVKIASAVPGIALPAPPVVNESAAANESKGFYSPEPAPKTAPDKVEEAPADVQLPAKTPPKRDPAPTPKKTASTTDAPAPLNAIPYGQGGQPAIQYGQGARGEGPAGISSFGDGAFGDRYGAYVQSIVRQISRNWLKSTGTADVRNGTRVYVTFRIARDGSIENFDFKQRSNVHSLDRSAERAILASNPLPPLPSDYRGSSVDVTFYFEYVR